MHLCQLLFDVPLDQFEFAFVQFLYQRKHGAQQVLVAMSAYYVRALHAPVVLNVLVHARASAGGPVHTLVVGWIA